MSQRLFFAGILCVIGMSAAMAQAQGTQVRISEGTQAQDDVSQSVLLDLVAISTSPANSYFDFFGPTSWADEVYAELAGVAQAGGAFIGVLGTAYCNVPVGSSNRTISVDATQGITAYAVGAEETAESVVCGPSNDNAVDSRACTQVVGDAGSLDLSMHIVVNGTSDAPGCVPNFSTVFDQATLVL
jgi:hypothetical protein